MAHLAHPGLMKDPWRMFAIIIFAVVLMLLIAIKAAGWLGSSQNSHPAANSSAPAAITRASH